MNPTMKKSLLLLTLSTTMATGAAYAAPNPASTHTTATTTKQSAAQAVSITINGQALAEKGYLKAGGSEPMLPLRAVADALGFTLAWNTKTQAADLNKGNIFTTVKTGEDQYAINKMYTSLGTAPELISHKLYVPASFVDKVLHATLVTEGNSVTITMEEQQKSVEVTGVITAVYNEEGRTAVQIRGVNTDGIVLNVGKDTVIEMAGGTKLAFADLHLGMTVKAEHSLAATASLPPQTPTFKITVQDAKKQVDLLGTAGTIEEVREGEKGATSIVLKGAALSKLSQSEVVLNIGEDTAIVDKDGKSVAKTALVQGATVIGFYDPTLTRSLPPIGNAHKIVVEEAKEELQNVKVSGVITAVNDKEHPSVQIQGVGTEGIVLNIGKDTVLEAADGSKVTFADLHVGMTVDVEHSPIMTFSLPPRTTAVKITVREPKLQADLLGTAGEIGEVRTDDKGGVSVVIKGTGVNEQSPSEVVLNIGKDTTLINKDGKTVAAGSLVKGAKVIGFYGPMMMKSLPPIGNAVKVVVNDAKEEVKSVETTGVITAVNNDKERQSVQIQGIGTEGIVLNVGKDTELQAADGSKLTLADLKPGMTVKAEHSLVMTMSLPPQTPTYKITVLDTNKQIDLLGTAGEITEVSANDKGVPTIRIKGTGISEQSPSEVVLRLTGETTLINKNGQAIEKSALVKGAKVIGFYGPMMTKSLPPIGAAEKVVLDVKDGNEK